MTVVKIRNLDHWIVAYHMRCAGAAGRSLEDQIRHVLKEAAISPRRNFAKRVKRRLARFRAKYGVMPDSTPRIRAERDGRS